MAPTVNDMALVYFSGESHRWVAHLLNVDIMTFGPTAIAAIKGAIQALKDLAELREICPEAAESQAVCEDIAELAEVAHDPDPHFREFVSFLARGCPETELGSQPDDPDRYAAILINLTSVVVA